MLELINIHKNYNIGPTCIEVLKGVSLTIERGDFLAIMGESGSGKTSLMNIIGMLDKPTGGDYLLNQKNINQLNDNEISRIRNREIGFVFQSFHLLPRLSALDNVGLPLLYRGMREKDIYQQAKTMLSKVAMQDWAQHAPSELSGGQQQRIAIARALVGYPTLLLADEPTGALDKKVSQEIMDLFTQLNQEGITIVLITHDPDIAAQCKNQLELHRGQIIQRPPRYLLPRWHYSSILTRAPLALQSK
jgi:putative ABC transport system ATP-binding protein